MQKPEEVKPAVAAVKPAVGAAKEVKSANLSSTWKDETGKKKELKPVVTPPQDVATGVEVPKGARVGAMTSVDAMKSQRL